MTDAPTSLDLVAEDPENDRTDGAPVSLTESTTGGTSESTDGHAWRHETGPRHTPTSTLANGPVISPPHTVDAFVKAFLHELNFGQGVPLSRSSVNDQYLALARTVRGYLTARWLETASRRRKAPQVCRRVNSQLLDVVRQAH